MALLFNRADLQRELQFLSPLARNFLVRESREKLKELANKLEFKKECNIPFVWQTTTPIETKCSNGKYERSGGGTDVSGWVSFNWKMKNENDLGIVRSEKASTEVCIFKSENGYRREIIKWNMDIKHSDCAPGPMLHTQVHNCHNLPVPRFPSLLFTPADCLDFLLGELFVDEWPQHQSSKLDCSRRFRSFQQKRLHKIMENKIELLDDNSYHTSSWIALKNWNACDNLFI